MKHERSEGMWSVKSARKGDVIYRSFGKEWERFLAARNGRLDYDDEPCVDVDRFLPLYNRSFEQRAKTMNAFHHKYPSGQDKLFGKIEIVKIYGKDKDALKE